MLLLVLALMFSFTSCHKDGVYTPKKKISEIYRKYPGGGKQLEERWHWSGKLLDKIEYLVEGESFFLYFKYNKKQLIEVKGEGGMYKFIYSGSKLSRIELLLNDKLAMDFKVTHTKNKITKIEVNEYYDDWDAKHGKNKFMIHALRGILPETTCENIPKVYAKMAQKGSKGIDTYYITYTYDGNNIKEEKYSYPDGESTYRYKYDKEKNPFYNLLYGGDSYSDFEFSKNNITHISNYDSDGYSDEGEYIYTYEKGYPIEKTYRDITDGYVKETTYYEYLE